MRITEEISTPLLGVRLRQLRLAKGMSLKDLAGYSGSSASAIHRYESGWDRFEVRTLRRLATALGAELEIRLEQVSCSGNGLEDGNPPTAESVFEAVAPLFWDVDLIGDHVERHRQWILRRVLEYGDRDQVSLSRKYFGDDAVRRASQHRSMDARVRNFWEVILGDRRPPK